jgi:agmatinase
MTDNNDFNPSGFAVKNGNFIGLPYDLDSASIVFLPVPWEATVSYSPGTAKGPENIREASYQLDLYDADFPNAYQTGIYMLPTDKQVAKLSKKTRKLASEHIERIENGKSFQSELVEEVNRNSEWLNHWVKNQCTALLDMGKMVGLIGGDHSTPLGYLHALAEKHDQFGILQIDAHCDLRNAYEGFTYSHASIFYNALTEIPQIKKLVQVGIRDYCHEEVEFIHKSKKRIEVSFDQEMKELMYVGQNLNDIFDQIIAKLPDMVYISFDIDGLQPNLCPNTGTPVAGGLELQQAFFLLKKLVNSGKTIIGFDLCEVGSATEWDGNVGARIAYKMATMMAKSNDLML